MKFTHLLTAVALCLCAGAASAALDGEIGDHHTKVVIEDITDPEQPRVLFEGTNVIGQCGVRSMMTLLTNSTNMGAGEGAANSLGQVCAGTTGGTQKTASNFSAPRLYIGRGGASSCTASATPWKCCTGSGTGCTPSKYDVITFAEGQPNGSNVGVETNFRDYCAATSCIGNIFTLSMDSGYPRLHWDGSNTQGVQFRATSSAGQHTSFPWCEWAIRNASGGIGSGSGIGAVSYDFGGGAFYFSGWQLNHAAISPCITKVAGEIWRVTVTITFH